MKKILKVMISFVVILCLLGLMLNSSSAQTKEIVIDPEKIIRGLGDLFKRKPKSPDPETQAAKSQQTKADLVASLKDLREAMLFKIDADIKNTATSFGSVKSYWRSKRWADLARAPLRVLQGALSLLAKASDWSSFNEGIKESFDQCESIAEFIGVGMMVNGLREAGEKLFYALNGPYYVSSVDAMLKKADATQFPLSRFDIEQYKKVIENHLNGPENSPLIVPRKMSTPPKKTLEVLNGALQVKKVIISAYNEVISQIENTQLPVDFPLNEITVHVKDLKSKIVNSTIRMTKIKYTIPQETGKTEAELELGVPGSLYCAFGLVSGNLAQDLRVQQTIEWLSLVGTAGNIIQFSFTYKVPGKEAIKIVQQVDTLGKIILNGQRMFNKDPEEEFYMLPQAMLHSIPTELSNLLAVSDGTAHYVRSLLEKEKVIAQPAEPQRQTQLVQKLGEENLLYSLIQKLKDQDPNVRRKAAKTLGEIKDPRAVEPLIDAMKGKFPYSGPLKDVKGEFYYYVREAVAEALGEIKDPRAVEPLIDFMKDPVYHVREEAARALGKIKDTRAVGPLIFAVNNDKYESVRRVAIWALGEISDIRAVDLLISVLKGKIQAPSTELGDYAVIALQKIGEPGVKPLISAFKSALKEKDPYVQVLAEKALRGIKDQRAVEPLIAALKDEHWKVREIAAEVLGMLKDHRAVEPLIVALGDEHPLVQSSVRQALKKITGKDFGKDQKAKAVAQEKMDKIPKPSTHTGTYSFPRYPKRLIYPVSEISMASEELVYFIEARKHSETKGKIDQLIFLRNLIIKEMETGLERELETLRPEVAEEIKNNLTKILEETEEIISLVGAPAYRNNLEKIKSIRNQINETSKKIVHILE